MTTMMNLINNMPEKPERMSTIKSSLIESANSNRPNFRDINKQVSSWKEQGYSQDPNKVNLNSYSQLNFNDITNFYKDEIKNKPIIITIVGNSKRFDIKELEKYGEVIKVKENDLFVN